MKFRIALAVLALSVSTSLASPCTGNPPGVFCSADCTQSFRCIGGLPLLIENCASSGKHCYRFPDDRDAVCSTVSQCGGPIQCFQMGEFPDPNICTKYHECPTVNGQSVVHECEGTAYNIANNRCELEDNDPGVCGPDGPVPECALRGQVGALPGNPSYYFVCMQVGGILYPGMRKCGIGLVYDSVSKRCVEPSVVTTTTTSTTTTTTMITTATSTLPTTTGTTFSPTTTTGTTATSTTTTGTTASPTTTTGTTATPTTTTGTTAAPTTTPGTTATPTTTPPTTTTTGTASAPTTTPIEITTLTTTITSIGTLTSTATQSTSTESTSTESTSTPSTSTPCPCSPGTPGEVDPAIRQTLISAVRYLHAEARR